MHPQQWHAPQLYAVWLHVRYRKVQVTLTEESLHLAWRDCTLVRMPGAALLSMQWGATDIANKNRQPLPC